MYGVDQCRCCGVKITSIGAFEREECLKALHSKKGMPEAEWRKLGFLAPPTHRQLRLPSTGCCYDCGMKQHRRKSKPFARLTKVAVGCLVAFLAIWIIGTYVEH